MFIFPRRRAFVLILAISIALAIQPGMALARGKTQKISKKLVDNAEELVKEIGKARKPVDKTVKKYNEIFDKRKVKDRQKAYKALKDQIKKTRDSVKKVRKISKDMQKEADRFFSSWSKELAKIEDSTLRDLSNEAMTESRDRYGKIIESGLQAGSLFESFLTDLENQGRYLEIDMSDAGMAKLETSRDETGAKAQALFRTVDELVKATNGYISSLK
jgi:F0F1-type ATP synthase membrane subunit b/b'